MSDFAGSLPGVVVWRIDRDKVNRRQVLKVIGSDIHKRLTARNPLPCVSFMR